MVGATLPLLFMIYYKILNGKVLVGLGITQSDKLNTKMYNDKFDYQIITHKQFQKLEIQFNNK